MTSGSSSLYKASPSRFSPGRADLSVWFVVRRRGNHETAGEWSMAAFPRDVDDLRVVSKYLREELNYEIDLIVSVSCLSRSSSLSLELTACPLFLFSSTEATLEELSFQTGGCLTTRRRSDSTKSGRSSISAADTGWRGFTVRSSSLPRSRALPVRPSLSF